MAWRKTKRLCVFLAAKTKRACVLLKECLRKIVESTRNRTRSQTEDASANVNPLVKMTKMRVMYRKNKVYKFVRYFKHIF